MARLRAWLITGARLYVCGKIIQLVVLIPLSKAY
jgi:hypothetical protein